MYKSVELSRCSITHQPLVPLGIDGRFDLTFQRVTKFSTSLLPTLKLCGGEALAVVIRPI